MATPLLYENPDETGISTRTITTVEGADRAHRCSGFQRVFRRMCAGATRQIEIAFIGPLLLRRLMGVGKAWTRNQKSQRARAGWWEVYRGSLGPLVRKCTFVPKTEQRTIGSEALLVSATYGAGRVGFKVIPRRTDAVQSLIPPWPADTLRGLISHLDLQYLHFRKYTNPPGAG